MNENEFKMSGITAWHKAGYTGKNIKIANMEGTDPQLPFFHGKIKDPFGNISGVGRNYHGHQTADILHQVAPDADIYSLSNAGRYSSNSASGAFTEQSIPFMEQEKIHLVNASLGGNTNAILKARIEQAQEHGVTFVTSAGNEAESGVGGYARSGVWIAVGAVHLSGKGDILHAGYSSIGEEVDFTQFSGLYVRDARKGYEDRTFPVYGTSFSSPALCGMLALVQQFFLEKAGRTLKQDELYKFMQDYSIDLWEPGHDTKSGYGLFLLPEDPETIDIAKYTGKEVETLELRKGKIQYAVVHHPAKLREYTAAEVLRVQLADGYATYAYNKLIEPNGKVVIGRDPKYRGAHVYNEKDADPQYWNENALGYCLVWNGEEKPFPEIMYQVLAKELKNDGFKPERVKLHREVGATLCPGKHFDRTKMINYLDKEWEARKVEDKKDYEGHWAQQYIEKAVNTGYMAGYPDGSFKPDNPITRAEFCRVLSFIIDKLERR